MSDQTTEVATEEVPVTQATSLQLTDILLCAQVIQLATTRGSFRAEELTQVGGVYDRLVAFLKESGAVSPATPPAETDGSTDAPAAE